MAKHMRRWGWSSLGGTAALLAWGAGGTASAAPTAAQILGFSPHQPGIDCTTPSVDQAKTCKVSLIKGRKGSGWLMTDSASNPIRRFYDSNDDNKIDVWCYYKDGVETYREVDTNFNGKPDQYRWLHTAGAKWGIDVNEDGRIDSWKVISPEEVSQEIVHAVTAGDYGRLQALLLTEAEIKALELAPAEAQRLRDSLKQARAKFDELATKLKGLSKPTWMHLETSLPQCRPADAVGSRFDLVRHTRGTVLFEAGGKSDWLQTGEMVKAGDAWRLVEGPAHGAAAVVEQPSPSGGTPVGNNPKVQKKVQELTKIDETPPASSTTPGPNPEIVKYNLKRADVLEAIIAEVSAAEREPWVKQLADSLSTAVQNSPKDDAVPAKRMALLEKQIVDAMKGSNLAAYVSYRAMQADYNKRLLEGTNFNKVQQDWIDSLTKFVAAYASADECPDALLELGKTCEFLAKETDAKKWYAQLAKDFSARPQGVKARGAVRRLDLEGKPLELAGSTLDGGSFDLSKLRNKVVVVYYWASWNQQSANDFAKLKQLAEAYGSKGFEVVSVNLDGTAEEAQSYLKKTPAPGTHLHQDGGLEGPMATDYGIMVLPNLFLAGKDGKVVSRTVQIGSLEDEVKKLLK